MILSSVCDRGCPAPGEVEAFGRGVAVVAVLWWLTLALILRSARYRRWGRVAALAGAPLPFVLPLPFVGTFDGGFGILMLFVGWIWGIAFAVVVRRLVRPTGRIDEPIPSGNKPWDAARIAFGVAIAAPFLAPIVWAIAAAFV